MVCGPTAAGKSGLADAFADSLSEGHGAWAPTIAVDSMQVYREVPTISNQARRRRAELVGVVSVAEEWTVARHKERVEALVRPLNVPFVLDAGTGMYLNALVLEMPLAPAAPPNLRAEAQRLASGTANPRRAARAAELELMGAPERGSIWSGDLRYDAAFVYLRPPRSVLDENIAKRSAGILQNGIEEAEEILRLQAAGPPPNPSVREAVGVKEMMFLASGTITFEAAQDRINARTRRLARRQMRWFDKLARTLQRDRRGDRVLVAESPADAQRRSESWHTMHGIIAG